MGYYTDYELSVVEGDIGDEDAFIARVSAVTGYEAWESQGGSCWLLNGVKWYDNPKHMLALSLEYPDVRFELKGVGEETGDFWTLWARNGKVYQESATIVYPVYDESKLN